MYFPSPLRYPGGKRKLAVYLERIVIENDIQGGLYIEPFAGGANVALYLLFKGLVNKIIINDIDRSIYAFWDSTLNNTESLCKLIADTPINMVSWNQQKAIQKRKEEAGLLQLGFSTFFLNRTNRSGILQGGVIGGKAQNGEWKMDARFNKSDLIKRIENIAKYRDKIELYNKDAIDFIYKIENKIDNHTLIYFDPPYFNQGAALYANFYAHDDHLKLSQFIQKLGCKWVLTYDYTEEILGFYQNAEKHILTLSYTAQDKTRGREMLAFSPELVAPTGTFSSVLIE